MTLDEIVSIAQHHAATVYQSKGSLKNVIVPAEVMVAIVDILGEHSSCGIQSRDVVEEHEDAVPGDRFGVRFDGSVHSTSEARILLTMYLRACDIADERNKTT